MKIVVLAGGLSPERDVSLSSGSLIANALIQSGHKVSLIDLYESLDIQSSNYEDLFFDAASGKSFDFKVPDTAPNLEEIKNKSKNGNALIGSNVLNLCQYADIVFIALHGSIGENGQLQAVFDTLGIKYTGTGYIGSLLAMDKDITKKLLVQSNIPTAEWTLFNTRNTSLSDIINSIKFPCVIKPCSCGSSIGISIVDSKDEFKNAIALAQKYEEEIIIETFITGRELSIGILDGNVLPPIEIIPNDGFYDYKNKYQAGLTKEICPANLSKQELDEINDLALRVHKALRLGSYSRVDFILNSEGQYFCLEANTLPGMTPTSLIPQEAMAIGITYEELCCKIASLF